MKLLKLKTMKMNTIKTIQGIVRTSILCLSFVACSDDDSQSIIDIDMPDMAPNISLTALTNDNQLAFYNAQNLNTPSSTVTITGLQSGEMIISIDYRPATGQLYGLGSLGRLYFIHEVSGLATALSDQPLNPAVSGANASIDFNPTVDRIRLVTDSGQNLRLHPDLGTVVATDGNLNPGMPKVSAAAYTNNFAGTASTLLYVIDHETNMLYTQTPPNDGVLVPVGPLGVDVSAENGFDIGGMSNSAFAVLRVGNAIGVYRINLMTGSASKVSDLTFSPTAIAVGLGF